jgi:phage terminase large subunit-like protein
MLDLALRRGERPQAVVTTTPRPIPALKRLMDGPATVVTRARTIDNAGFLSEGFAEAVRARVGDGALARQELDGEIVEDIEGALWTRADLDAARAAPPPDVEEIAVAVDPPVGVGPKADACGIVVVGAGGRGRDRRAVVLADASARGLSPLDWAGRVAAQVVSLGATRVVAEANQGGEMVRTVLAAAGIDAPIRLVRAFADKRTRAAPVAALYAQGRVAHAATFPRLEDEMRSFGAPGFSGSPDRLDALVWAVSDLMLDRPVGPRVRRL